LEQSKTKLHIFSAVKEQSKTNVICEITDKGTFDATLWYTSAIFERLRQAIHRDNPPLSSSQHVHVSLNKFSINANAFECDFDMCVCDRVESGAFIFKKEVSFAFSAMGFFDKDCEWE
jgi:hypothetical protein